MTLPSGAGHDRPDVMRPDEALGGLTADGGSDGWGPSRLLAALVEGSDDAIFAKSLDGVILTWNSGAQRIYGYTPGEIIGSHVSRLVPPDAENDVPQIMERLRRGEGIQHYETERMARDGRRLTVSLTVSPIRAETGELVGASTIARDITALRRAEARSALLAEVGEVLAAVLDAEEVLRRLARLSVTGLADYCVAYLLESDGTIRRVGLAHADEASEHGLRALLDSRPPRLDDEVGAGMVIRTGESVLAPEISAEVLQRASAGSRDYLEILTELAPVSSMVLPLIARGRTVGAVAFATTARSSIRYDRADLAFATQLATRAALALDNARLYSDTRTEVERRRSVEEELRRRYDQLRALYRMTEAVARAEALEAIYDEAIRALLEATRADRASVLRFDDEGVLRFVSWKGLSEGYRGKTEGHTPWSPDTTDARAIVVSDVASEPSLDEPLRATILAEGIGALAFVPLAFGDRLLGKFMLYFDRPGEIDPEDVELARTVAGTIAFAAVRVEDERRVREAREVAEQANHAKSQFLGVMSHELRTPLNSVLGYADLLLLEAKGPVTEQQRQYIERIQRSATHQLRLVEEILTYARLEAGRQDVQAVSTDLHRSVADVMEFVRPEAVRKGLVLESDLPDAPVRTMTDPARVRQILLNLAGNAVKFTDHGRVTFGLREDGDTLILEVRDTGRGITDEEMARIWEPFARGDADSGGERGGTGLGLAIARRFAQMLGGTLDVESRAGEGSTFTLRLPHMPRGAG